MATGGTGRARHHYVLQFHLRRFGHGHGAGRIWVFDKTSDTITSRSVKAVAPEIGYYTINDRKRRTDDGLEALFSRIESWAAPILRRLSLLEEGEHEFPAAARGSVAGYLALLHARVPGQRDQVRGMREFSELVHLDMDLRDPDRFAGRARGARLNKSPEDLEALRTRTLTDHQEDQARGPYERPCPRAQHPRLDRHLEREPPALRVGEDRRPDPSLARYCVRISDSGP